MWCVGKEDADWLRGAAADVTPEVFLSLSPSEEHLLPAAAAANLTIKMTEEQPAELIQVSKATLLSFLQ